MMAWRQVKGQGNANGAEFETYQPDPTRSCDIFWHHFGSPSQRLLAKLALNLLGSPALASILRHHKGVRHIVPVEVAELLGRSTKHEENQGTALRGAWWVLLRALPNVTAHAALHACFFHFSKTTSTTGQFQRNMNMNVNIPPHPTPWST